MPDTTAIKLISVIVPVYNASRYLRRCIKSVISQNHHDLELILVNDGSTDDSIDICNEYAATDSRITVIDKPNGGVSSARNAGIEVAKGEYITFLDSDDYYSPDFIESFNIDEGADFLAQGCVNEYTDGSSDIIRLTTLRNADLSAFMETMLVSGLIMTPWAKLYSNRIIKERSLRFDENLNYAEDRLFNMCYLRFCTRFSTSSAACYHYIHENPDALTKRYHKSDKIGRYLDAYKPNLDAVLSKCLLSDTALDIANNTFLYHLIQAMIQNATESDKPASAKKQFHRALSARDLFASASRSGLPAFYRISALAGLLPTPMASSLLSGLYKIKTR